MSSNLSIHFIKQRLAELKRNLPNLRDRLLQLQEITLNRQLEVYSIRKILVEIERLEFLVECDRISKMYITQREIEDEDEAEATKFKAEAAPVKAEATSSETEDSPDEAEAAPVEAEAAPVEAEATTSQTVAAPKKKGKSKRYKRREKKRNQKNSKKVEEKVERMVYKRSRKNFGFGKNYF